MYHYLQNPNHNNGVFEVHLVSMVTRSHIYRKTTVILFYYVILSYYVGLACPAGTVKTIGIQTPLYMKAGCGVTPPPTGNPPTRAGGVPCVSGVLLPVQIRKLNLEYQYINMQVNSLLHVVPVKGPCFY